eukprot:2669414-Prymnesium_polylepis.3
MGACVRCVDLLRGCVGVWVSAHGRVCPCARQSAVVCVCSRVAVGVRCRECDVRCRECDVWGVGACVYCPQRAQTVAMGGGGRRRWPLSPIQQPKVVDPST